MNMPWWTRSGRRARVESGLPLKRLGLAVSMVLGAFALALVPANGETTSFRGEQVSSQEGKKLEFLVRLNRGAAQEVEQFLADHDFEEVPGTPRLRKRGWIRIRKVESRAAELVMLELKRDPRVRNVVVDAELEASGEIDLSDPFANRQWNLEAVGFKKLLKKQAVGSGTVVALLDTGLTPGPDLLDLSVLPGYDALNGDDDASDDHQHGTLMASILASAVDNGVAVAGLASGVTVLPVKVLDSEANGRTSALVEGLYFAAEQGAQVVNMSLAYPPGFYPGIVLDEALEELSGLGILLVAATGNWGSGVVSYPAAYPAVIAVAASAPRGSEDSDGEECRDDDGDDDDGDDDDGDDGEHCEDHGEDGIGGSIEVASYSSFGTALDIVAPGGATEDVDGDGHVDGILGETFNSQSPQDYSVWVVAGTSGATVHVTAACAVLLGAGANPNDVRWLLESSAKDAGPEGFDVETGTGHLRIDKALKKFEKGKSQAGERPTSSVELLEETLGDGTWLRAKASLTVTNGDGHPVKGALIYGHFAGAAMSSHAAKTGDDGHATVKSLPYPASLRAENDLLFVVDRVLADCHGNPIDHANDLRRWIEQAYERWRLHYREDFLQLIEDALAAREEQLQQLLAWQEEFQAPLPEELQYLDDLADPLSTDWLSTAPGQLWLTRSNGQDWLFTPAGQDWLLSPSSQDWLFTPAGQVWIFLPAGQDWLFTPAGQDWLISPSSQDWLFTPAGQDWLFTPAGQDWLFTPAGQDWLLSPSSQDWLFTPAGQYLTSRPTAHDWLLTPSGQDWLFTPAGQDWLLSPSGQDWLFTPAGQDWLLSPSSQDWLLSPSGQDWLLSPSGQDWLLTPAGQDWLLSPSSQDWLLSPSGQDWLLSPAGQFWTVTTTGQDWLLSPAGQDWLLSPLSQDWLLTPAGQDWLLTPAGQDWLLSPAGQDWLLTPGGQLWALDPVRQDWLLSPSGQDWLLSPAGQDWLLSPAGQGWSVSPLVEDWLLPLAGEAWLAADQGMDWLLSPAGQSWLGTGPGLLWSQSQAGTDLLTTPGTASIVLSQAW